MTFPAGQGGQGNYAYVVPGGEVTLTAKYETYAGSGLEQPVSGAEITIAPAAGGPPVIGPTSDGLTAIDEATYQYRWLPPATTPPGDYQAAWNATGPDGTLTITLGVTVVALPGESPSPGVYCTIAQYRDETGDTTTPDFVIQRHLRRACDIIDGALISAVYPVDADSMPTVPAHIQLFMRATAAQIEYMVANNDPANVKQQYASTSMGGVSQTRTASAQGGVMPRLAPAAAVILQQDGALPGAALLGW